MRYEIQSNSSRASRNIFILLRHIPLLIWAFIVIVPILMLIFAAFKTNAEYAHSLPITPPKSFLNFANFKRTLIEGRIINGLWNSFILMFFGAGLNVLFGCMTAFCFNRFEFALKKYFYGLFMVSAMVPNALLLVLIYKIMFLFHLTGTFGAPILLYAVPSMIQVWIYLQFLERVPVALDESAMIDGASYIRIFTQIIFPLLAPATATVLITQTVFIYSDMFTQYLYMSSPKLQTATTALMTFSGRFATSFNVMAAGCVGVMIPSLIIFLFLKKYIFEGLTVGSVKG